MKTKSFFSLTSLLAVFLFFSCVKDTENDVKGVANINNPYTISIDKALSNLDAFESSLGIEATKASRSKNIQTVKVGDINKEVATKADTDDTNSNLSSEDPCLYIVNFGNEEGFALLSADTRLETDVIAYTENGSISVEDFKHSINEQELNPDENDDITQEEFQRLLEEGYVALSNNSGIIGDLCSGYCNMKIVNFAGTEFGGGTGGSNNGDENDDNDNRGPSKGDTGKLVVTASKDKLVKTIWHQDYPFNSQCPMVGFLKNVRGDAGCVPIALAQIFVANQFPNSMPNIERVDYYNLGKIIDADKSTRLKDEILTHLGKFVAQIGKDCKTHYHRCFGYSWSFTWPAYARDCMEKYGYRNVILTKEYDEELIISQLNKDLPVFIAGVSGCVGGHGWIIDGYKIRQTKYEDGTLSKEKQILMHCNLGWHGLANGYYYSGIFDTTKCVAKDYENKSSKKNYNFQYALRTITYDL